MAFDKEKYFQDIDEQRLEVEIFRKEKFPLIAKEFDLPQWQKTILKGGIPHYYGFDGYDPFCCQLPICTNGEPIQVGKRYATSSFGSVLVVQVTRSTIYHYFLVVDDDGEQIDDLKIDEFLHSQF